MRVENGYVAKIDNGKVLVETAPDSGCSTCAAKGSCLVGNDPKVRAIWIDNTIGASIGDEVHFSLEEKGVVAASFLLYFLPVVLLVTGLLWGASLGKNKNFDETLSAIIGGVSGLAVSFLIIWLFSLKNDKKSIFFPILIDVIEKSNKLS